MTLLHWSNLPDDKDIDPPHTHTHTHCIMVGTQKDWSLFNLDSNLQCKITAMVLIWVRKGLLIVKVAIEGVSAEDMINIGEGHLPLQRGYEWER